MARFHQQSLVKVHMQSVRPREDKAHLQMQEGRPGIAVPSFQGRCLQSFQGKFSGILETGSGPLDLDFLH